MVCLGFEPMAAEWSAQTKPRSYGDRPVTFSQFFFLNPNADGVVLWHLPKWHLSPNVHKSCPKMISLEKLKILAPTQKLPKTVWDLGKLIAAKGFKKLPKV